MPATVVAAIGARDVQYEDPNQKGRLLALGGPRSPAFGPIAELAVRLKCEPTLMQLSELPLAHYDAEAARIRCPILGPPLRHILAKEGSIERLLLIVTEQAPPHSGDTITAGRLVARRLRDEFGSLITAVD